MKTIKKILVGALCLITLACFNQRDEITISKSGNITMESVVEVTGLEDKDVLQGHIDEKISELKQEGWKVSYKWLEKSRPFKLRFKLSNSIENLVVKSFSDYS